MPAAMNRHHRSNGCSLLCRQASTTIHFVRVFFSPYLPLSFLRYRSGLLQCQIEYFFMFVLNRRSIVSIDDTIPKWFCVRISTILCDNSFVSHHCGLSGGERYFQSIQREGRRCEASHPICHIELCCALVERAHCKQSNQWIRMKMKCSLPWRWVVITMVSVNIISSSRNNNKNEWQTNNMTMLRVWPWKCFWPNKNEIFITIVANRFLHLISLQCVLSNGHLIYIILFRRLLFVAATESTAKEEIEQECEMCHRIRVVHTWLSGITRAP